VTCVGDDLVTCGSDGLVADTQSCILGCNGTALRCNIFQPTGLDWTDVTAGTVPLVVPQFQTALIDTDAEVIWVNGTPLGGFASHTANWGGFTTGWVVSFSYVDIQGEVHIEGSQHIAIVARTTIVVAARVDAAAHLDIPGPGGAAPGGFHPGDGGDPTCTTVGTGGGGGGGHAGLGGNGTPVGGYVFGAGGPVISDWQLNPLVGGGAGGSCALFGGIGGAAGGNLLMAAGESIDIQAGGYLETSGGGGRDASGGGGAGGLISLEAPTVTVGGTLHTRGGGGGCYQGVGADGWFGGSGCETSTNAADGGNGGYGGSGPGSLAGEPGGPTSNSVGAGGGGAAGFIVINVGPAQGSPALPGVLIPNVSSGAVYLGNITPE